MCPGHLPTPFFSVPGGSGGRPRDELKPVSLLQVELVREEHLMVFQKVLKAGSTYQQLHHETLYSALAAARHPKPPVKRWN